MRTQPTKTQLKYRIILATLITLTTLAGIAAVAPKAQATETQLYNCQIKIINNHSQHDGTNVYISLNQKVVAIIENAEQEAHKTIHYMIEDVTNPGDVTIKKTTISAETQTECHPQPEQTTTTQKHETTIKLATTTTQAKKSSSTTVAATTPEPQAPPITAVQDTTPEAQPAKPITKTPTYTG